MTSLHERRRDGINATAMLRVPARDRDASAFLLSHGSDREFLPHIAIPAFGYSHQPSEEFKVVVTTGVALLRYRSVETLTLSASYIAVRTVDVRLTSQLLRPVRLSAGSDRTNERYLRADRADADERLFCDEKRARAGVIIVLARQFCVDADAGCSFDRFCFEGEDYADRRQSAMVRSSRSAWAARF